MFIAALSSFTDVDFTLGKSLTNTGHNSGCGHESSEEINMEINDAIWQDYDSSGQIDAKLATIRNWIPADVGSIIDLGCGNGIICNALASEYAVTAIDISETALKAVKVSKLLASATDIPFADNSFDLAFSSEMLEHLSSPDLEKAAREMLRVARKYLLISVPNREQLGKSMVKCKVCAEVYHAYGHLHSFTDSSLRGLFPGTQKLDSLCFGPTSKDYHPLLLRVRNHLGGQYFHPAAPVLCPRCGSDTFVYRSNPVSKACNLLNNAISRPKPYWLMLLLVKVGH